MNNFNIWENTHGCRIIIDCWVYNDYSYAVVLFPNNVLRLVWVKIKKDDKK